MSQCAVFQVDLQPRVGTSSTGISREAFISNVARDIAGKIPEPFDTQLLKKSIGVPSPTQVVLLQETERWNKVTLCPLLLCTTRMSACLRITGKIDARQKATS